MGPLKHKILFENNGMARCFQFSENGKPVYYKQMISLANLKSWSCRCKECTFAVSCFKTDNFKLYIDGVECVCVCSN